MLRKASAIWKGNLKNGNGSIKTETGTLNSQYSFSSRFENGKGTNPEELIGAAHAGCFSMALSHALSEDGYEPENVKTIAEVKLIKDDTGFSISKIKLTTKATVPNIKKEKFLEYAEGAKENCPVSKALKATPITLDAELA